MSKQAVVEVSRKQVFDRAIMPLMITWLLLMLPFVIPLLDSTSAPYFNLTLTASDAIHMISFTGGKFGVPFVGVLMLIILISRDGINHNRRWKEAFIVIGVTSLFAGGGAFINEHFVKEKLKISRPNILWLAGEEASSALGMTAEKFYELGDKQARSHALESVLNQQPAPIQISPTIKSHWIEETGYSFPSGHSFSALFFSTIFICIAVSYITCRRIWLFYALLPWALAVCYSRTLLRVHTPFDILLGGLQGILLGLFAWEITRLLINRIAQSD